jgi:C1A family cysteine protease
MSKVEDQGNLGSCTAHSVVAMIEFLDNKDDKKYTDYSRLFLYYNTRAIEGSIFEDSGASIRNTIKAAVKTGVCPENGLWGWEYNEAKFKKLPSIWCYWRARDVLVKEYLRLSNNLNQLKYCIANGNTFAFGFMITDKFMDDPQTINKGIMSLPKKGDAILGGHAVCAVGYDDNKEVFIIRNSWSESWGDKGYFYMPYDFITDPDWCSDFWTATRY